MAQFGLQPNGMIRLRNGSLWNPHDELPPEDAQSFNGLPMGNPLQPQSMQRAVAGPAAPTAAPTGMFGAPPTPTAAAAPQNLLPASFADPVAAKPSFFGEGGTGRNIAGIIGDALLTSSGHQAVYAPLRQQAIQSQRDERKQGWELQRQMALQSYKEAHPAPTEIARNVDYFKSIGRPELVDSYLRAQANPQTLMTNPTTGAVGFYPKGGIPPAAPAGPPAQAVSYLRQNPSLRAQFDAKYGAGASAQVLGQ